MSKRGAAALLPVLNDLRRCNKLSEAKSLLISCVSNDDTHCESFLSLLAYRKASIRLQEFSIQALNQTEGGSTFALHIFKEMLRLRWKPTISTCHSVMDALIEDKSSHANRLVKGVFQDLLVLGVVPEERTFLILIKACCMEGKFEEGLGYLRGMDEFGLTSDHLIHRMIDDASCKEAKLIAARAVLKNLREKGLFFKEGATYDKLVCEYCTNVFLDEASELVELMTRNSILPAIRTCNRLLKGFCDEGRIDQAFRLMREMESSKLLPHPDDDTYNTLIGGCVDWHLTEEAFRLVKEKEKKGGGQMDEARKNLKMVDQLTTRDGIDLVTGCCNCKAGDIGTEMERKYGFKTLNATRLRCLCWNGKLDEAYEVLSSAREKGYLVGEENYLILINGYFKDERVNNALKLWGEMKQKGILPTSIANNTLISGLCRVGQAEKAFQFHKKMTSFQPDSATRVLLLEGLCSDGLLDKALELFKTWISEGKVLLDVDSFNTMISSLCNEGRLADAFDLLYQMEEKNLEPDCCTYMDLLNAANGQMSGKTN